MTIQSYPDELNYVNAKLKEEPGTFMKNFLTACLFADAENYESIRISLHVIEQKYPADPTFLMQEQRDSPNGEES